MKPDLAVIGGGLIGLATAFEAAEAGLRVTVLEAGRIGRGASAASAGGVRSLNRDPAEIPLARAALPLWRDLDARLGASTGFAPGGQLRVAEDAAALEALSARAARTRALGWTHERLIGANALRAREPALEGRALGALLVEDDGFADPLATLRAYRRACAARGVALREGARVERVAAEPGGLRLIGPGLDLRAGAALNAAGVGGAALAEAAGDPVRVRPVALQMSVTERLPRFLSATLGTEGRKLSLKQTAGGHALIGGGHLGRIDAGGRGHVRPEALAANLAAAARLFPHLAEARVARVWAGVEAMAEDGLPAVGASTTPGLVHAFGFSAHGFALAPLIGRLIADMVRGRAPDPSLAPFAPARFARPRHPEDAHA